MPYNFSEFPIHPPLACTIRQEFSREKILKNCRFRFPSYYHRLGTFPFI